MDMFLSSQEFSYLNTPRKCTNLRIINVEGIDGLLVRIDSPIERKNEAHYELFLVPRQKIDLSKLSLVAPFDVKVYAISSGNSGTTEIDSTQALHICDATLYSSFDEAKNFEIPIDNGLLGRLLRSLK